MTNAEKFKEVFGKELDESLKFDTSCSHISQIVALRSMYIKGVDNIVEWLNAEFVELKGEQIRKRLSLQSTTICKYCYHWQNGRCKKTQYNTDMLTGKGKWLGIKTSWNHYCRSGDFTQREGDNK